MCTKQKVTKESPFEKRKHRGGDNKCLYSTQNLNNVFILFSSFLSSSGKSDGVAREAEVFDPFTESPVGSLPILEVVVDGALSVVTDDKELMDGL